MVQYLVYRSAQPLVLADETVKQLGIRSIQSLMLNYDQYKQAERHDTVGTLFGNKYLPEIRNSKSLSNIKLKGFQSLTRHWEPILEGLSNKNFKNFENELSFKLICYESGGFFTKHCDSKSSPSHFATLLIFPPNNNYEGGDLILYIGNKPIKIKTNNNSEWTYVIFKLSIAHECTTVKSGRRFVFKTELKIPYNDELFSNKDVISQPIKHDISLKNIDLNINELQNKINKLNAKLDRYQLKRYLISQNQSTPKINKFISKINSSTKNVVVILQSRIPSIDPNNLDGEEALFYNEVIKKWPLSTLQLKDIEHYKGDGKSLASKNLMFNQFGVCDSWLGEVTILYWVSPQKHDIGYCFDKRTEFNDETFDEYSYLTVVMLCIPKN